MDLKYKGVKVFVSETDEKISVTTDNLTLAKALKENGFEVLMKHTLTSFLDLYKLDLVDTKGKMIYKRIKTLGQVLRSEETYRDRKKVNKIFLLSPTKRSMFYIFSKDNYKDGEYLYLEGSIIPDEEGNKNRSTSEKIIGYGFTFLDHSKIKVVELLKEKKTYERPRYELHLHTIHSQRDAHITHTHLKEAFEEGKLAGLAITNHGINNCFPDSVHEFGKGDHKVIPAVELYVVDDQKLKEEQQDWELENHDLIEKLEESKNKISFLEIEIAKKKEQVEAKTVSKPELKVLKEEVKTSNQELREEKKELKALESQFKELEKTKPNRGDAKRYHLIVLVKSEEATYKDDKYEFQYNPGIYELNKLITEANTEGLAQPVLKKWMGTRPTVSLSSLEKVKQHFIIGGACTSGLVNDALIHKDNATAEKMIGLFDYLEIQPLSNNYYLMEEEEYKQVYPNKKALKDLNRKIYDFAKANGKKVCFTSDAHVIDKTERFKRAIFKKSYIGMICARMEQDLTKVLSDNREEKQPWLHSYEEMVQELTEQGFSEDEIEELYQNEKEIFEQCRYFNNTTIFPKQMFIPDFPGLNVKEELPKLAFKKLKEIYGPDPGELILNRVNEELAALSKRDFEFIYYVSSRLVQESESLNFPVGKPKLPILTNPSKRGVFLIKG